MEDILKLDNLGVDFASCGNAMHMFDFSRHMFDFSRISPCIMD